MFGESNRFLLLFLLRMMTNAVLCAAGDDVVFVNANPPPRSTEIAVRRVDLHQKCALFAMKTEGCQFGTVKPTDDGRYECKCFKLPDHEHGEVAQGKPCTSSIVYQQRKCENALDGTPSTLFTSENLQNPFWQVDLQGLYKISHLIIFVRTSDCCFDRFDQVNILVGMSAQEKESGKICQQRIVTTHTSPRRLDCVSPRLGQFVFIQRVTTGGPRHPLEMYDVQVFGQYIEL